MKKIEFLTKDEYIKYVNVLQDGHWTKETINIRWDYHFRTIELIKSMDIVDPKKILEMGTMGVSCVKGSDTIDYLERWDFKKKNPTYINDARLFPWPIENKKYDVFVALRVFQHLVPAQSEAVIEAMKISKKIIIVIPEDYDNVILPNSKGITYKDLVSFLKGVHPNLYIPTSFGNLFYWDTENPSYLNLEEIMKNIKFFNIENTYVKKQTSNYVKIKTYSKKLLKKIYK